MRIPKRYGESKIDHCPFCGRQAITSNDQGVPVCIQHKKAILNDMKCLCGEYLDIRQGKYGMFFSCMKCGPISASKAFEVNEVKDISKSTPEKEEATPAKKYAGNEERTIRSDDEDYFS